MPTAVLQISGEVSSGNFSDNTSSGSFDHTKINDSSNSTHVYNTTQNQTFLVNMDNTSGLSGSTFNAFLVSAVFQKQGARGADASFEVNIGDSSGPTGFGTVQDTTFVTTNSTPTTINGPVINFGAGVSSSDVDSMRLQVTTTDSTQVRFFQLYVTIDYTLPSGYGHEVNNVGSSSIAKVKGVATASIAKVIGVD